LSALSEQSLETTAGSRLPATGTPRGGWRGAAFNAAFGATDRRDAWWVLPLLQLAGLAVLFGYATWAAFQGNHYAFTEGGRHYLSPFYSPLIQFDWWPLSPALLILAIPGGFRATCYYYRKAYYRAAFADPIACAVGEPRKSYCGEATFPFILQNVHRYFLYLSLAFLVFLWWDVIQAFLFTVDGQRVPGIGGGSLAILASTGMITLYTLSCHSLRHLIGGRLDCFSCAAAGGPRQRGWSFVSALNGHHMALAWWSLFAVCLSDFYVRMCSMGVIQDPILTRTLFSWPGGTGL
jgi:hypothetical protein